MNRESTLTLPEVDENLVIAYQFAILDPSLPADGVWQQIDRLLDRRCELMKAP